MMNTIGKVLNVALVFLWLMLAFGVCLKLTVLASLNYETSDLQRLQNQKWNDVYGNVMVTVMLVFLPLHFIHFRVNWIVSDDLLRAFWRPLNLLFLSASLFVLAAWTNAFGLKVWLFG